MSSSGSNPTVFNGLINGESITAESNFAVVNPATQEAIGLVSDLGAEHAQAAIDAAADAFTTWKTSSLEQRIAVLSAWADEIESNTDTLALTLCAESGKPMREARGEIMQCAALLHWFAQCVPSLAPETISKTTEQINQTLKQPVGVVAIITPWNFPAAAVIVKAGAAIAAGCSTVVKPSEHTPLIALALASLGAKAGLPAGVMNVIPCANAQPVGDALCRSSTVRMLSFTGSTRTGQILYAACAGTIKRVTLELGGNAPFIVFDDADLERAVNGAMNARFYNSGQICVGANRYLVQDDIYDTFAEAFSDRALALKVGDGHDDNNDLGPLINTAAVDRLDTLVNDAVIKGAHRYGANSATNGLFFAPVVLGEMTEDMAAYHTEIFGPVACLYRFSTEDQALKLANDTNAGLAAYIYTQDADRIRRFSENLEAGVVGANSTMIFANDLPFGGIKQSGIGREHGRDCLAEYVEIKSVCRGS